MRTDPGILAWFGRQHALPPSFEGNQLVYAFSVFGLMTVFLLSLEWLWRIIWAMREQCRPLRHPVTVSRLVLVLLLTGILMRVTGNVVLTMMWPELTPGGRLLVAQVDRLSDGASAMPMLLAWLVGVLGGPMVDWQLVRKPIPVNLWPTWRQMRRPAYIGAWVLGISLAVTYLR